MSNQTKSIVLFILVSILIQTKLCNAQIWNFVNPKPNFRPVNEMIKIPGSNKLIGVGKNGSIITSEDEGENWEIVYLPTSIKFDTHLNDVKFIDSQNGFAGGYYGSLLKTADGGQTWQLFHEVDNSITGIEVLSDSILLLSTRSGTIFRSLDLGASWEFTELSSKQLRTMCQVNDSTLITVDFNGRVFKTMDYGISWFEMLDVTPPENSLVYFVHFIDSEVGFIGTKNACYRTTDQGETWNSISALEGVSCEDMTQIGTKLFLAGSHGTNYDIYESPNKGLAWWEIGIPEDVNISCLCTIGDRIIGSSQSGYMIISDDDGSTWESKIEKYDFFNINDISFIDNSTGFLVGETNSVDSLTTYHGMVFKTSDAGESWFPLSYFHSMATKVDFFDENNGTLSLWSSGTILKTTDGGHSWTEIEEINPQNYFWEVKKILMLSDSKILISVVQDSRGIIFYTEDGGSTWTEAFKELGEYVYDIHFLTSYHGIAVGETEYHSIYLESLDGGKTWLHTNQVSESGFYDMCFVDNQTGYLSGSFGRVYKTEDGGGDWETIQTPEPYMFIKKVAFTDKNNGYIIGDGDYSYIYKTVDGGESWFPCEQAPRVNLYNLHFFDKDHGLIFGHHGVIAKTASGGVSGLFDKPFKQSVQISAYPNPFTYQTKLTFSSTRNEMAEISIYDLQAKLVYRDRIQTYHNGENEYTWTGKNLAGVVVKPGIYLCKIRVQGKTSGIKLIRQY